MLFIVGCQEYPTVAMTGLKPRLWGFLNENRVKIMTILGDYTVSVLGEDGYKVTTWKKVVKTKPSCSLKHEYACMQILQQQPSP